jgi:glycosyltransferase involved in cell wall biosynthesis
MQDRPVVKFVAVLPPPHTGMTAVSAAMEAALGESLEVRPFVLRRDKNMGDGAWSARKHWGLLTAMARAVVTAPRTAAVYLVLDSGGGAWGSALLALIARISGAPLVVHHHVFSYFTAPSAAAKLFFRIAGRRALHLTLCSCMAERLREQFGADQATLVLSNPAFVDAATTPPPRPRRQVQRLGFLGNVTRDKGIGLFMETVRRLNDQGVILEAQIAGPVRDPAIAAEIADFVAEDPGRRRALGPVYGAAKQIFLDGIDVVLFPSQYVNEAQPITIYEALATGAPVLATDRGCVPEQLPSDWVFPEAAFVEQASAKLAKWSTEQLEFADAHQTAISRWNSSLSAATQELAEITSVLARLSTSRHYSLLKSISVDGTSADGPRKE